MARPAIEVIAPYIKKCEEIVYNPTIHGEEITEAFLHGVAVRNYLQALTGDEDYEEVLSVTAYGLGIGLSSGMLLPGIAEAEEPLPFEAARVEIVENFYRVLGEPETENFREVWTQQDIAEYRGVNRSSIKDADNRGSLPTPQVVTRSGVKLWSPKVAMLWSDANPRRAVQR